MPIGERIQSRHPRNLGCSNGEIRTQNSQKRYEIDKSGGIHKLRKQDFANF